MPRRPSIDDIIRDELFALEQQQALEQNPESMARNPDGLEGGMNPSPELMYKNEPMMQWGGRFEDQPSAEEMALRDQQRGNAVGREFGPRESRKFSNFNMIDEPQSGNPSGMRGLAGAYNSLPIGGATPVDPNMQVLPRVPEQNMQQLMDFYINGGTDI